MLLTAITFLIILSVLVLIHEAGHFFVAKKLGIKVEEFGFGFPPKAFSIKRGETEYSINWLPIGGFVKLYGEDEAGAGRIGPAEEKTETKNKEDEKRAFYTRSVGQRAAVVIAGVIMNAILAILIYYAFMFISSFHTELPLLGDHKFFLVEQQKRSDIIVSEVEKNSPAEMAGIQVNSRITSLNSINVTSPDEFVKIVQADKGKKITIAWQNLETNQTYSGSVTPRVNPPKNQGALGVAFFPAESIELSYKTPVEKALSGIVHPINLMLYNFDVLGQLLSVSIKERNAAPISQGVSGPVGIYSLVGTIVQIPNMKERILQILNLSGILSISLAFFNILPIPALDGGRLFFILLEGVTGRKVNPKIEGYIHQVGMAILLLLIILITYKDIAQQFAKP